MGYLAVGVVDYWGGSYCGCCPVFVEGNFVVIGGNYPVFGYSAFRYSMGDHPIDDYYGIGFGGVVGC